MKKMTLRYLFPIILLVLVFSACQVKPEESTISTATEEIELLRLQSTDVQEEPSNQEEAESVIATETPHFVEEGEGIAESEPEPTPDLRLDPADWQNWPVVPAISANGLEIYMEGIIMGNDPTHFSKVGDCQNVISLFLGDFDNGWYRLGEENEDLQEVIDYYEGSWGRESMAVKGGYNVASVLNPMFANQEYCEINETPLACEFRIHQPSIALISMETWGAYDDPKKYEFYMRKVLDEVISDGVMPILATKADNLEGNHVINQAIAQLAYEYDIPMWNFWAAANPLPDNGLSREDHFHLTVGLGNYFDNPENFVAAWPIRNLTALQTIDAVYDAILKSE
ncbi:MAG: hypothetical protein K8R40_09490 [Anaerolineaceae bacterium]|nr:hypothetical protein [Anaerolineaceae bacterium]